MSVDPAAVRAGEALMRAFAERTAIEADGPRSRRYLWTDAFSVCNFLALHRATGNARHLATARALVDAVHATLGRHRPDDVRRGWLSGLEEAGGHAHPTRGGLRIGKPLPERAPGAAPDERSEWDRDGQYFHYLTRWMHALVRVAADAEAQQYLDHAFELAVIAHRAFGWTRPDGRRALRWKMSVDLRRPLVASMGQHDPVDGLVTCLEVRAALLARQPDADVRPLDAAIADLRAITAGIELNSADGLGIGGALTGAHTLARLLPPGPSPDRAVLLRLLAAAVAGLAQFRDEGTLSLPPHYRLAFRELGLAIGLRAVPELRALAERAPSRCGGPEIDALLAALGAYEPLADAIVATWLLPARWREPTWLEHRDINEVMLATGLLPEGYLAIGGAAGGAPGSAQAALSP